MLWIVYALKIYSMAEYEFYSFYFCLGSLSVTTGQIVMKFVDMIFIDMKYCKKKILILNDRLERSPLRHAPPPLLQKTPTSQKCPSIIFEPRHEISNNVVCATSKASDQPEHTCSLIRAFASRLNIQ